MTAFSFYRVKPRVKHEHIDKCVHTHSVRSITLHDRIKISLQIYEPPRFMTVNQCVAQLLEVEASEQGGVCGPDALAVGIARVGRYAVCF